MHPKVIVIVVHPWRFIFQCAKSLDVECINLSTGCLPTIAAHVRRFLQLPAPLGIASAARTATIDVADKMRDKVCSMNQKMNDKVA